MFKVVAEDIYTVERQDSRKEMEKDTTPEGSTREEAEKEEIDGANSVQTPTKNKRKHLTILASAGALLILATVAIATPLAVHAQAWNAAYRSVSSAQRAIDRGMQLKKYQTCVDLAAEQNLYSSYHPTSEVQLSERYVGGGIIMFSRAGMERSSITSDSSSYSTTNVQVEGIDEADIVKNDANYIYTVGGSQLIIVRAHPTASRAVISRTELNNGAGTNFTFQLFAAEDALLYGDRLVVLINAQVNGSRTFGGVVIQTWNVTDRVMPLLIKSQVFEGSLATSRLVGDHVFVAISTSGHLDEGVDIFSISEDLDPSDIMPLASTVDDKLAPVSDCRDTSFVSEVKSRSFIVLASISILSGELISTSTISTGSRYVEASILATATSIYVATYNDGWSCERNSCRGGFWCIDWGSCTYESLTAIVAFDISGDTGEVVQRAVGGVPGYLLSQWSMDEWDGHLRVAYTFDVLSTTENRVDVLNSKDLRRVGRLGGLGMGERIYAMRFMADLAYMVTFRQIDPLYSLDMSNHESPFVIGELKITGFSEYLHPINSTMILGIGTAGDELGNLGGLKVSLFDVSDLSAPREAGSIELGGRGSNSLVASDHRALLFDKKRNLLVIPVMEKNDSNIGCDDPTHMGVKVFDVGGGRIETLASIQHSDSSPSWESICRNYTLNSTQEGYDVCSSCSYNGCSGLKILRSLYIGNDLFTLSEAQVQAHSMQDWQLSWSSPLFETQMLAAEGTCTLDGQPLPWARAAASSPDIHCNETWYKCDAIRFGDSDFALSRVQCDLWSIGGRTFNALLDGAASCCGTYACTCPTQYDKCRVWF